MRLKVWIPWATAKGLRVHQITCKVCDLRHNKPYRQEEIIIQEGEGAPRVHEPVHVRSAYGK